MLIPLLQKIGHRWRGLRGLDRLMRLAHSPGHRRESWITGHYRAKWGGPELRLETRFFVEWTCFFYGSQDDRIHAYLLKHARPEWVAFDVGANFGFYSVLLASLCPKGRVHSFEPVGWLCDRMRHNATHNGVEGIISVNQVALAAQSGTAEFLLPAPGDENQGTASLLATRSSTVRRTTVHTTTIDDYVATHRVPRLDFMKIDVEGAEHLVIRGALASIARFRPVIIAEANEGSITEVVSMLKSLGYESRWVPRLRAGPLFSEQDNDRLFLPPK